MALAFALCATAHADERAQPWAQSRAVAQERLAELRAGVAAPHGLQQAGVILWDEPRKAPPPPRHAGADSSGGAALTASVNYR
jgi:hypothetical protein